MWNWGSISHPQKHQDDEVASPKQDPGSPGSVPLATLHWRGIRMYCVLNKMSCIVEETLYMMYVRIPGIQMGMYSI